MGRTSPIALLLALSCAGGSPDSGPPSHDWPEACPDPDDPGVDYMHATWAERDVCAVIDFDCSGLDRPLVTELDCGCGCITPAACRRYDSCTTLD